MTNLLILVHPGSACGSADFNCGSQLAQAFRADMIRDLSAWDGDILVLDSFLGDELPSYPEFDAAIRDAVRRNKRKGHSAERHWGCDNVEPHTADTLTRLIGEGKLAPGAAVKLTGASYDPDDECGCVNGVYDTLREAGFRNVEVLDSAMPIGPDGPSDDMDDDEEDEEDRLETAQGPRP